MPVDAVPGILSLFDDVPLVALGELHGVEQEAALIAALVQHPTFPRRANAIVVEFGNALHQDVADRYVGGADVAPSDVRRIWRDFAGGGPWGFRAPIYEQFFATVRAVNQALPPSDRIRVLLGDPPVDWQALRTPEDARGITADRDTHFAGVVEREVLRRGHRALLVAGTFHFLRRRELPSLPSRSIVELLDDHHPGGTYVIAPHSDIGLPDLLAELEARLASWPVPGLAAVRGTWLGALPASTMFGGRFRQVRPDGTVAAAFDGSSLTLSDLVDAYLYLGPSAAYTRCSEPDLSAVDAEDGAEVERRAAVMGWDV